MALCLNSSECLNELDNLDLDSDMSIDDMLMSMMEKEESDAFQNNGYSKLEDLCTTLQGRLVKARKHDNKEIVAIKKIDKVLCMDQTAERDEFTFCVSQNIIKESAILKHLTVDSEQSLCQQYLVQFIDFFETDTDYNLVMEYVDRGVTLRRFVAECFDYIQCGKLSIKQYRKCIKFVLWQLFVTINWLHQSKQCCHLDLCFDNILIQNGDFIECAGKPQQLRINPEISVKLCDFGVSEIFPTEHNFQCSKTTLSLDNAAYAAPKVYEEEVYDARCADIWSLGMILFECLTNTELYQPLDRCPKASNGYLALCKGRSALREYLACNNLLQYFSKSSFDYCLNY